VQRLGAVLSRVALGLLLLGTVGMIAAMLVGVADVVGTEFLGRPLLGTLEFTESTMVLVVFGALAYAQERRAHIRVELLYSQVGPHGKSFMEAVTHIVAFLFFALVAWQGYV
jgi:TRAP-type C4-dicarboxylate transport system permease small subunit